MGQSIYGKLRTKICQFKDKKGRKEKKRKEKKKKTLKFPTPK
jgi:hypothetical protein